MGSESLARAMTGGLTYDSASWDKLTAMALGSVRSEQRTARESLLNSLGVSLLGFKHAMRADLFNRCVNDLRDCLRWRLKNTGRIERTRIASAVIHEWVKDVCPPCKGAGIIFDSMGVERVCMVCQGSLKRRYSDQERAESMGIEDASRLHRSFDIAHAQLSFAVGYAIKQAVTRLSNNP